VLNYENGQSVVVSGRTDTEKIIAYNAIDSASQGVGWKPAEDWINWVNCYLGADYCSDDVFDSANMTGTRVPIFI